MANQRGARGYLDSLAPIDWTDFEPASTRAVEVLATLAEDRAALGDLVRTAVSDTRLRSMCERDEFRQKLVLYECDPRGFRVRLHTWRHGFTHCIHAHRFPYVARILRGRYRHIIYGSGGELYPDGLERVVEQELSEDHPLANNIRFDLIRPLLVMDVQTGNSYAQHPEILSASETDAHTVSLFVRGPTVRDYGFQWRPDDRKIIWKGGQAVLSEEQNASVRMSDEEIAILIDELTSLKVI